MFDAVLIITRLLQEHTSDVDSDAGAMDYTNIESLIPLKGREDLRLELEKKRGEAYSGGEVAVLDQCCTHGLGKDLTNSLGLGDKSF